MYKEVKSKADFTKLCNEVANLWQENNVFEKSLKQSKDEVVFYDGPPFPTGSPHHGTIFVSVLKDSLARYFTMRGNNVPRRWGWDCHGLPIENSVEKELGLKNKSEIETKFSVAEFNEKCREYVSHCNDSWETYINKIGRWVDYENSYKTLDTNYMESVLWVFKTCYDKGLIYKDYRVTPYCWHCETSLSISDTRESDSMRPKQDPELTVKFKAEEKIDGKETYFLAWTTTPWTLPSNLFLAVGKDYDYVAFEYENEVYIMSESRLNEYKKEFGKDVNVVKRLKGSELVGKRYQPLFNYFKEMANDGYYQVLSADFVTLDDGVGIVHVAPAFGEDDYWLAKSYGFSVCNPVDSKGCFTDEVTDFKGRNVLEANPDVIKLLKSENKVIRHATINHNYPHCWRCREPLIYRADDAWYFAVEKVKPELLEQNQKINWVPGHLKNGRFGKWLEGARDWNISRSRYWGTPLPVWECQNIKCSHLTVLGSVAEIEKYSDKKITDLHKEHLDEVEFECQECGSKMKRVPEVLDCWFESASMPYGQCHYPFENKEWFDSHFPADFIVEYPAQLRGWFYYLHVLSVSLFKQPVFKNCLVHGTLLAEDGTKLSKSKKNYTDPMKLIDNYGADALRIYLLSSPAAVMSDMQFSDKGVENCIKNVLLPLWNAYSFFTTYANIDNFKGDPNLVPEPTNELDQWILASLYKMEKEVSNSFETYYLNRSLSPVLDFISDLTNWYIRRSRERFWQSGFSEDKNHAYDTLYYALVSMVKILAPSTPFVADEIYRNLTGEESVHLAKWPDVPESFNNTELVDQVALTRKISALGLALRHHKKLKVRQPLQTLHIALPHGMENHLKPSQLQLIKNELNIKEVEFLDNPSEFATLRAVPNARVLGPKFGRDMQHIIKAAREGNVKVNDNDSSVIVFNDTSEWKLDKTDINIGYQGREGVDVTSEDGILVGLDVELTPELLEEGVVNELNRKLQNMRKENGYNVTDRIKLNINGSLSEDWKSKLANSVLAELTILSESEADAVEVFKVADREFKLFIKR